ncbi:YkgJ family cysteine cluster protein [uncultured Sunxiuqinia sp.]|uniref:YkgJ family cysteine cluster protein n=1 Tax=uncultured Sunxiuqinia sp. TaxID=1573825 RepID=UPI002AA6B9FF|nr:YkgJ family cysteine cluster protein [uncultured Sunxiuqinia sp.]
MESICYYKPEELKQMTANRKQEFSALFQKLKKKKPKNLDTIVHALHEEAFNQFDCLDCANCCSSISPIITDNDVNRLAKSQKMKASDFTDRHLYLDEDQDYVFQKTPCPFLMHDNYCCVYNNRPRACREYPHTDRKRFYQILNLTRKNCEICPIVYAITNELTTLGL